ncbi:MAG: cation transporting ATPase C-terminal domain-containing protein [Pseudonocardiaceae bacterium]
MQRPPRDPAERLLSRFVVIRTIYVGVLMSIVAIALFLLTAPLGTAPPGFSVAGPRASGRRRPSPSPPWRSSRSSTCWSAAPSPNRYEPSAGPPTAPSSPASASS